MEKPDLLAVHGLRKAFGGLLANDAITLGVAQGAIAGLIGPNGSGKTTLFDCVTGHAAPDDGTVEFQGRRLQGLGVQAIARLGLLRTFQQARVFESMTCLENMQIAVPHTGETYADLLSRATKDGARRAIELLDFVGLGEMRAVRAGELSYGQRKLLELGMGLMGAPKMLLLDEPTAGVAPRLVDEIVDRVRKINRTLGITMLIIEHNMRVVMDLAERVHCLARGRLLASGTPQEIRADARVIEAYLGAR